MKKLAITLLMFIAVLLQVKATQNAPVTIVGSVLFSEATTTVPIKASNFTNIGSCNLEMIYDPAITIATNVTMGPQLGGYLNYNLTVPGQIMLGWYTFPGVTIPDNTVIFNISFQKVNTGTTTLSCYDDGYSCIYYDGNWNPLNDSPFSNFYVNGSVTVLSTDAPHTSAPVLTACPGTVVSVPITVSAFDHIGSVSLLMHYNSAVLTYQSSIVNPAFPGLTINGTVPGTITANGLAPSGGTGITLPGNTILFTISFNYLGGSADLSWYDDGNSCKYSGPPPSLTTLNDSPQSTYYSNGSVGPEIPPTCDKNLNITLFVQGLYIGNGMMRPASNGSGNNFGNGIADKISIELHSASNYSTILYSVSNVYLNTNGTINVTIPSIYYASYYVTIRHRNSVAVVSALPVSFTGNVINYNFTDQASKAYGNNLSYLGDGKWALFAGDVNQDDIVDSGDMNMVDNGSYSFATGYLPADCNGDGLIDSSDMILLDNNAAAFISALFPGQ